MESQLLQIIEFLVQQQFYKPDDIIMDRTKDQRIHVENSGQAIYKFVSLLSAGLSLIIEGNYKKYLEMLKKHFDFDENKVVQNFFKQISFLRSEEREPGLTVTFLLGEVLGDVRETVFKRYLQQIRERLSNHPKGADINFEEVIAQTYERNEPNIALIYNLCFLKFIAKVDNSLTLQETTKALLEKYTRQFIGTIIKED